MIGIDTNVLIRFLVDDDPDQNRSAREMLSARTSDDPAFLSAVTLAETVWILTRGLGYSNADVAAMLRNLLASDGVVLEHAQDLGVILGHDNIPKTDIADYLIVWSAVSAGCARTVTFDKRAAAAIPSMELLT